MQSLSRHHPEEVFADFQALVDKRHLPTDMISNAIVLSQGALWKHRMLRNALNPAQSRMLEVPALHEGDSLKLEWGILNHLLSLHLALLEVGKYELSVPPPGDAPSDDLAQRITGTFRRTLPALRIASKWLRANFKYLIKTGEAPNVDYITNRDHKRRFWRAYADFMSTLSVFFPISQLPPLAAPLEEDIEMRGFLPLKKMMGEVRADVEGSKSTAIPQEAHPNDWQLMRIADLLNDARELARTTVCLAVHPFWHLELMPGI